MDENRSHGLNVVGTIIFVFFSIFFFTSEKGLYPEKIFQLIILIVGLSLMVWSCNID